MRRFLFFPAVCLGALALAGGAAAGTPRFGVFDLHTQLAGPSHNAYGDVKIWKRPAALARRARSATLVRCGGDCTFGAGWLAFSRGPALASGDISGGRAKAGKRGWSVFVTLNARGRTSWLRFSRNTALAGKTRGVPDAFVVVLDGVVIGQPLADELRTAKGIVEIPGLSRANALRAAKRLG